MRGTSVAPLIVLWAMAPISRAAIIAVLTAGSIAVVAAPSSPSAYERPSDNLALGLDKLRWGMTSEEVRRAYPDLNFTATYGVMGEPADDPDAAWGPLAMNLEDYREDVCTFGVYLTFYHARLKSVGLHSTGDALRDCRRQVSRDFTAQYGQPEKGFPHWAGPVTSVSYDVPAFAGPLNPPPGPTPLSIGFFDPKDISGFQAAMYEDTRNFCQRITVTFLPDSSAQGASTPMLAPRLKDDLGCDYPRFSFLSMQQGTVVLDVRVLADGTVDKADVTVPDSHMLLNSAALDIVQKKIQLIPAIKDGKQVAVTRQVAVTFKLIRPLRGVQ